MYVAFLQHKFTGYKFCRTCNSSVRVWKILQLDTLKIQKSKCGKKLKSQTTGNEVNLIKKKTFLKKKMRKKKLVSTKWIVKYCDKSDNKMSRGKKSQYFSGQFLLGLHLYVYSVVGLELHTTGIRIICLNHWITLIITQK